MALTFLESILAVISDYVPVVFFLVLLTLVCAFAASLEVVDDEI